MSDLYDLSALGLNTGSVSYDLSAVKTGDQVLHRSRYGHATVQTVTSVNHQSIAIGLGSRYSKRTGRRAGSNWGGSIAAIVHHDVVRMRIAQIEWGKKQAGLRADRVAAVNRALDGASDEMLATVARLLGV